MSKKYNIYGLGGALVDTEVMVSEAFLVRENIKKGVMTIVDESYQTALIEAFVENDCKLTRQCGGSVCNSMVAASSLGSTAFFSGKVADDDDGELFIEDLKRAGIDFHIAGQEPGVTGKCLVMVTNDAERTMHTFLGVSETLSAREIDKGALINSEWFYVEGYLVTDDKRKEVAKRAIDFARTNGTKIAVSLSDPFVVRMFNDALRYVMGPGVDLIFCNKDEALEFTGADNLESALKDLGNLTKTFAITDGANGAIIFDGDSLIKAEGVVADAIDTNGAGDMFAGAFLFAITSGKNYNYAAKLANECAAKVVEKFGPRLDSSDFDAIKKAFGA